MNRGGRRIGAGRKPSPNPRCEVLNVRLTAEEMASIRETAEHHGLHVPDLVRAALGIPTQKAAG